MINVWLSYDTAYVVPQIYKTFTNNDGEFLHNSRSCRSVKRRIWKCVHCFYKPVCLSGFTGCFHRAAHATSSFWSKHKESFQKANESLFSVNLITESLTMTFSANSRSETFSLPIQFGPLFILSKIFTFYLKMPYCVRLI